MKKIGIFLTIFVLLFSFTFFACFSAEDSGENEESITEEETTCIVLFNTECDTKIEKQTVEKDGHVVKPIDPVKMDKNIECSFLGWFYNGEEWDFDVDTVQESMTLTAKWKTDASYTKNYLLDD